MMMMYKMKKINKELFKKMKIREKRDENVMICFVCSIQSKFKMKRVNERASKQNKQKENDSISFIPSWSSSWSLLSLSSFSS